MTNNLTAGEWLRNARHFWRDGQESDGLADKQIATQVLLSHVLEKSRAWILAHPDAPLTDLQRSTLNSLFVRLQTGEPLAYLTGHQEFYGLQFDVTPDVLIPRPETELLVEHAIAITHKRPGRFTAADIGTGSGCIAASIAVHARQTYWTAVDRSWKALQVARRNAQRLGVDGRISFLQGDLLQACDGVFDLICANLPYIPTGLLSQLAVAQNEPLLALDGGSDGLVLIRDLLNDAHIHLAPGGYVLLEMQFDQGPAIAQIAKETLPGSSISIYPDFAGLPRLVEIAT